MPTTTKVAAPQRPAWFDTLLGAFEAAEAHMFLLHGGVDDYVRPGLPVRDYLFRTLRGPFQTVVGYSLDQGFTFADPSMRMTFEQRLGIAQPGDAPAPDADATPPLSVAPLDAMWMILRFLKLSPAQSATVIVERFELLAPTGDLGASADPRLALLGLLKDAGTDAALETRGNPLIMLASGLEDTHTYIRSEGSGIRAIEVPLPDFEARLAFIKQRLTTEDDVTLDGITPEQLAALTAGLYRRHVEDVFLRARASGGKLTRALAMARQKELMDLVYREVMQRVETTFTLADVGGHVEAKRYFEQRVVRPMRDAQTDSVPSNVLLVGPPGTGKTLLASAVANDSGLNCLSVDLSKLLGGIVGQTEQNVAKFKRGVLANAPCILILDEVDQKVRRGDGGGGGDSGGGGAVENRLFASVLEFFGDPANKGRVMGLFLSNRPERLDVAFMSRMQAVIPILPPEDDSARADVLARILLRRGAVDVDALAHAPKVTDWSGRDLDQTVDEAKAIHVLEHLSWDEALSQAIADRRPATRDVRQQVTEALKACNNLRLMPKRYRRMAETVTAKVASEWDTEAPENRRQRRSLDLDNQHAADD